MATPASISPTLARSPLQQAARTANVWGWTYIVTILGAFGAGYVPPGPLRMLLLNFGILCFVIGVLELIWRHKLLQTGAALWAKVLALNQVGGTLALFWSLYLLYVVPDKALVEYAKKSEMWNSAQPLLKAIDIAHTATDDFILHMFHSTKLFCVYVGGGITLLSQIWVIWHYLRLARQIAATPPPSAIPPLLK